MLFQSSIQNFTDANANTFFEKNTLYFFLGSYIINCSIITQFLVNENINCLTYLLHFLVEKKTIFYYNFSYREDPIILLIVEYAFSLFS